MLRTIRWYLVALVAVFSLIGASCSSDDDEPEGGGGGGGTQEGSGGGRAGEGGSLLAEVRDRGEVRCGVNNSVPGFGVVDDAGDFSGFDIDFCRAIAAAVLGDPRRSSSSRSRPSSASRRCSRARSTCSSATPRARRAATAPRARPSRPRPSTTGRG